MKNKPLIERVVTVTGKSVKNPGNFLCRIGTPISKLIEAAGGMPEDTAKVIGGGPMMGRTMVNIDSPVMKGTSGVLLINEKELYPLRKMCFCLPDGARTVFTDEIIAIQSVGTYGRRKSHGLHRMWIMQFYLSLRSSVARLYPFR